VSERQTLREDPADNLQSVDHLLVVD